MAPHIEHIAAAPAPPLAAPAIIHSYTCPRCRELNHRFPCRHCAWTPDVTVGAVDCDDEREDAIVVC